MDMNQNYLLGFIKYQNAVNREMYEFEKYSDKFIINPMQEMVSYHILIETMEGRTPSQTDLIFDLNISASCCNSCARQAARLLQ